MGGTGTGGFDTREEARGKARGKDGDEGDAEKARQFAMVDNTLLKNRTLTVFGEIDKDMARRTAERLLALSFEGDDPIRQS